MLAFETDEGPKLYGVDLEAPAAAPLSIASDHPLFALAYRQTLEERALTAGEIEAVEGSGASRPIASDYEAFVADLSEPTWRTITPDELPDSIRNFRLPGLPLGECEEHDGCFRYVDGEEYCEVPCVEPEGGAPMPALPAAEPEPPVFTPCPAGWNVEPPESSRQVTLCRPVSVACPVDDDVVYPGDEACAPAAGACPAGDFPENLPAGPVSYVLAGAAGGDGSEGAPFGTIAEAVMLAPPGAVIAVGKGSYPSVSLFGDVSLVGACAETVLAGLTVSASVSVSQVKIAAAGTAVRVDTGASAHLEEVFVSSGVIGLQVFGRATGRRIRIEDVTGTGVSVAGEASLDQVLVRSSQGVGVEALGSTSLTNVRVSSPAAVRVGGAASLIMEKGWLTDCSDGLQVAGGHATLEDVRIEGARGSGIVVGDGGKVDADRLVVLDGDRNVSVQTGATATLRDVYVAGGVVDANVVVTNAGPVEIVRGVLARTDRRGIQASDGRLSLTDLRVRDNSADEQGRSGEGILATGETVMSANRLLIERVVHVGIQISQATGIAELTAEDLTIREVAGPRFAGHGIQVGSYDGRRPSSAALALDRVSLSDLDGVGIEVVSDKMQQIENLTARRIAQEGIRTIGGVIDIDRADFEGVEGKNLSVASGEMVVNDLRIHDTAVGAESFGWIPTDVSAVDSALLLDRFSISGTTEVGVLVMQFSRVTFGAGSIFDNEVGVEVRADGFDFTKLEGDVVYRDNREHNLLASGQ